MALNIRNKEAESLANEIVRRTGETKTEAVVRALQDRLARVKRRRPSRLLVHDLADIALHCASLPVLDDRSADDILGYDTTGLPR